MNGFSYAVIAIVVIAAVAMGYGAWRYSHKPVSEIAADDARARELGTDRGLGPHAAGQDASWQNKGTHGNMG
jgi:hypothetical protein